MTRLTQWLQDWRWALNAKRARAWRRQLSFTGRLAFDDALRPVLDDGARIAYPDAIYHITIADLLRAMQAGDAAEFDATPSPALRDAYNFYNKNYKGP